MTDGDYCHGGCEWCVGSSGRLTCNYLAGLNDNDPEIDTMNDFFDCDLCTKANYGQSSSSSQEGAKCPHFIQAREYPIIATYQAQVLNSYQQSLELGTNAATFAMMGAGGVSGALIGAEAALAHTTQVVDQIKDIYSSFGKRGEITITYKKRYVLETSNENQAKLNKQPNKND
jgi:hypothetical protein